MLVVGMVALNGTDEPLASEGGTVTVVSVTATGTCGVLPLASQQPDMGCSITLQEP
jgi:hypothetical protein